MQRSNATEGAKAMEEELDQFCKKNICELITDSEIELGHPAIEGKWVYQVKQNVHGSIACFKAR